MSGSLGPVVADPLVWAWRCAHRLDCCRVFEIAVSPQEHATIRDHLERGWPGRTLAADARHLPKRDDGTCQLLEAGLCGYRVRFGVATQPRACRAYPYVALRAPTRRLLGLDFSCPTALGLLATADRVEAEVCPGAEAPVPAWRDLTGGATAQTPGWRAHADLVAAYAQGQGPPSARLAAAIARIVEAPRPRLDGPIDWAASHLPGAALAPLMARGVDPLGAAALFGPSEDDTDLSALPAGNRPETILDRYLAHRLLVPGFLRRPPSPRRLADGAAAVAVRWHVERARGASPLAAVRLTELWLLHRPHLVDVDQMGALTLLDRLPGRAGGVAVPGRG